MRATARGPSGRTCVVELSFTEAIAAGNIWQSSVEDIDWHDVFLSDDCSEQKAAMLFGEGFTLTDPTVRMLETDVDGMLQCGTSPPRANDAPAAFTVSSDAGNDPSSEQRIALTDIPPLAPDGLSISALDWVERIDVGPDGPRRSRTLQYALGSRARISGEEGELCAASGATPAVTAVVVTATAMSADGVVRCDAAFPLALPSAPGETWRSREDRISWDTVLPGCTAEQARALAVGGFTLRDVAVVSAAYRMGGVGLCIAAANPHPVAPAAEPRTPPDVQLPTTDGNAARRPPRGELAANAGPLNAMVVGGIATVAVALLAGTSIPVFLMTADAAGNGVLPLDLQHSLWLGWVVGGGAAPLILAPMAAAAIIGGAESLSGAAVAALPGVGLGALGGAGVVLGAALLTYGETTTGKVWVSPRSAAISGAAGAAGLAIGIAGIAVSATLASGQRPGDSE